MNSLLARSRALFLAVALASAPAGASRLARFGRRKTAYVATLLVEPGACAMKGLVDCDDGIDVLWQWTGSPRLAREGC